MTEKMKKKAGPPTCPICGSTKEAWTRKFPATNGHKGLLWICPNYCELYRKDAE